MTEGKDGRPALPGQKTYEVGYGKPPRETQFKPGTSGNPQGRPKGAKNKRPKLNEERLKAIVLEEAYRDITVRDGHRNVTIPMAQAIVRSLAVNAAKGLHRSQRLFAEMLTATERDNKALADEWLETALEYKASWERELHRREVFGITDLPPPLPHPDQIRIDVNTGEAHIKGPMTKEDQAEIQRWRARRDTWADEVQGLESALVKEDDENVVSLMQDDLAHAHRMLGLLDDLLEKIDA